MSSRAALALLSLIVIFAAACAGAEDGAGGSASTTASARAATTPVPPTAPTPTAPTTVVVVVDGRRAEPPTDPASPDRVLSTRSERPPEIPTALPTPTRIPSTPTPRPTATPRGQTFPALFPPEMVGRTDVRWLPVPYRSQLDGNPYQDADCGPASLAMVLSAFGKEIPTLEVRRQVNRLQGTEGMYDSGTLIENIALIGERYGLRPSGLFSAQGFRRWTLTEVRARLDAGQPIIPQVWYRGLPGRETRPYDGDHYVVLTGYAGDEFLYNDPIDKDGPGLNRRISSAQLEKAWRNSDYPFAGVALAGPSERPSLLRLAAAAARP